MEDNSLSSIAGVDVQTVLKDYDYTVYSRCVLCPCLFQPRVNTTKVDDDMFVQMERLLHMAAAMLERNPAPRQVNKGHRVH